MLKGPDATREKIRLAFTDLAKRTRPEDQFVFHYSGHGTQIADVRPFDEPDGRDEALCPWDANADGENLIRDDELGVWLDDLPARRIMVILDCCHAGTGTKDAGDDPETVSRFLPMRHGDRRPSSSERPGASCRATPRSSAGRSRASSPAGPTRRPDQRRFLERRPPRRAGQFSHFFIEGLRDRAADRDRNGIVSNGELVEYVSRRVDESFNQTRPGSAGHQNPALETGSPDAPAVAHSRRSP